MSHRSRIVLVLLFFLTSALAASEKGEQDIQTALTLFAKKDWRAALMGLQAANVQQDNPDALFYQAECFYQLGDRSQAERLLKEVVHGPFNRQEAYGRLLEIAVQRNDTNAVQKYTQETQRISTEIRERYRAIGQFMPDVKDSPSEAQEKTYTYYASRHGSPGETEGDARVSVHRFADAITAYEYAVEQNVPLAERLTSPLARRLYEKLASTCKQYEHALKKQNRPDGEVAQAAAMARYYCDKALAVRSPQTTE